MKIQDGVWHGLLQVAATAHNPYSTTDENGKSGISVLREEELKKAEEKKALTILRAPEDGIVTQLSVHTLGGVVKPADPILVVVPQGADLIVEAQVLNKDIGFVREGQNAEVKLEAFPFTRYGVLHATLEHISRTPCKMKSSVLFFPVG